VNIHPKQGVYISAANQMFKTKITEILKEKQALMKKLQTSLIGEHLPERKFIPFGGRY
jgi:hypothetical protein